MILSDLVKTEWYRENLAALMSTPHREQPQVRHCLALIAASKFKECSEACEQWVLAGDKARELWRSGTPSSWLANAYSFTTTVAVITGTIVPKAPQDLSNG